MVYIYELYTYIFNELDIGRIYSENKLSINELMKIIEKSVKVIGQEHSDSAHIICSQANKIINGKETRKNINEIIEVRYYFANCHNCGGVGTNNYNWLKEVIQPKYISKRFYAPVMHYIGDEDINIYKPCRFGLNITED